MSKQEKFLNKAKEIHKNKYDYSKTKYINSRTKIIIICPIHGEFEQYPNNHLCGNGCPKCKAFPKRITQDEYKQIFKEKYPTLELLTAYNGDKNYITVKCLKHDYIFKTKPNWLKHGHGCQKCYDERRGQNYRKNTEQFIKDAKTVHGDKYDYSKVEYKNNKTKVCIVCNEHGDFWQTPNKHTSGQGCPKCANKNVTTQEFIEKAKQIYGDKYDYSKVVYKDLNTKVIIVCPIHGEFEQTPDKHLYQKNGCPICNESKLEQETVQLLTEKNILFERQKKFTWLGRQSLDFYLPQYNIAIECQGKQHIESIEHFGGDERLIRTIQLDEQKNTLCKKNNLKIIYFFEENYENIKKYKIYNKNNTFFIKKN